MKKQQGFCMCGRVSSLDADCIVVNAVVMQCHQCKEQVWAAPSTQEALKREDLDLTLLCEVCFAKQLDKDKDEQKVISTLPGQEEELKRHFEEER